MAVWTITAWTEADLQRPTNADIGPGPWITIYGGYTSTTPDPPTTPAELARRRKPWHARPDVPATPSPRVRPRARHDHPGAIKAEQVKACNHRRCARSKP